MNKNIIQFIVNENGQYVTIPVGRVKAKSNLTTRIQLVTPITASVAVNYLIYDSKNIEKKQYLIPISELGSAVVDPNNPNYQLVAGWKVYEADIYAPILSVISKYKTGKVGMSFEFVKQVPNALCTNFVDYFGFTKELPEIANDGAYYICEDYNYWLNDKLYNKGDILVWYGEKWNNGGIIPNGLSETVDISVDPAISYPTEEVDETAFGNAIGELAEDVAELDTRLNGVETTITDKQDKVDLGLNTTDKTVVGAINEVKTQEEAHYNTLNTNKLDNNFNLLVERTFAQLSDWVAVRSGSDTLKMSLETLRTYLTQGLVGLSFVLVDELPPTGVAGVIYLIPLVENIVRVASFEELPATGVQDTIYITEDTNSRYQWNIDAEEYESYSQGYEEYIWLEELNKYELIGSTQVDLTGYATELWVLNNFIEKTQFSGGTTGQILAKRSNTDLDVEWVDKPTAPIQEIQVDGVEVPPVDGVVNISLPTINLNGVDMLCDPDKTYIVIKIAADNDTFTLLTGTTGSPNYTIEWGDGQSDTITTTANPTHTYEKAGMYLITISGSFTNGIMVGSSANANKSKIIEVYGGSNYPLSIGDNAFKDCISLTSANFPNVTSIGSGAFTSCTSLTSANFPNVTSIGNSAFTSCTSLTSANFPNATSIGSGAFNDCTSLTIANLPKVTSIVSTIFYNCTSLTTATFPNATSINMYAFTSCTSLITASFPKVTSIGAFAFNGCTSLKELTLGNVTTTETGTRFTSVVLDKLTISGNISDTDIERILTFYSDNGGTFSNSCEIKYGLQVKKTPTLDNDVVRKVDLDTKQNTLVSGIDIRTINNVSLLGAGNITVSGDGGGGVDYLKDPDKTYLVIKTPADNDEFTLLTGITGTPNYTIEWGDSVSENITDTSNLTHEYATAGMYLITISGSFTNGIEYGFSANANKNKIIEVYGGSNYPLSIRSNAFKDCISLTTANFPNATSTSLDAFSGCTSLTTVNFPNLTDIGQYNFNNCTSLITANFPNITSIDIRAFNNCTSLTTANFPNVTSIEGYAFDNCISLPIANFPKATSIGGGAFNGCTSLKELTLGNVTTTDSGTSFGNVKLVNLTIAQDVDATDIARIKTFYSDNGGAFTGTQINSI